MYLTLNFHTVADTNIEFNDVKSITHEVIDCNVKGNKLCQCMRRNYKSPILVVIYNSLCALISKKPTHSCQLDI